MDREKGDGNTILLTVIGVATLLVALVGATFAYFSAQITNDQNESVSITTAPPVGLQYVGKQFALTNIIPNTQNEPEQGTFEITNPSTSTVAQTYDLTLIIDANSLETKTEEDGTKKKELELTITSDDATISNVSSAANASAVTGGLAWDLTDGAATNGKRYQFIDDERIEIGETQTYQMTLNFIDTGADQNHNQGKNFRAHIEISNPVSVK